MAVQFNGTSFLGRWEDPNELVPVSVPVGNTHAPFSVSLLIYPVTTSEVWWGLMSFVDYWGGFFLQHQGGNGMATTIEEDNFRTSSVRSGIVLNQWNQLGGRFVNFPSKYVVVNGVVGPEDTSGFHGYIMKGHSIGGVWRGQANDIHPWDTYKPAGVGPAYTRAGNRAAEWGFWNRALTDAEWAQLGPVAGVLGSPLLVPSGLTMYASLTTSSALDIGGAQTGMYALQGAFDGANPQPTFVAHPTVRTAPPPPPTQDNDPPPGPGEAARPTLPDPVLNLMTGGSPIPENLGGSTYTVGTGPNDLAAWLGLPTGKTGATPCLNSDGTHKGNTYLVPHGVTYNKIILPRTAGAGYTCIRTTGAIPNLGAGIPSNRVAPSMAGQMFQLNTNQFQEPALIIPVGSNGWRIIGLHATQETSGTAGFGMIWMAGKRICLERSYIHGHPDSVELTRGIYIQSEGVEGQFTEDHQIWDTWIDNIRHHDADAQAIYMGLNARTHIENCHIEAPCQNIMVGSQGWGAYGDHVTIKRCHLLKREEWFKFLQDGATPNPAWDGLTFAGRPAWTPKGHIETKVARIMLVEGCLLENCWTGPSIMINTQDLDMTDYTVRHNKFLKVNDFSTVGAQTQDSGSFQGNHRHRWWNNLGIGVGVQGVFHSWTAMDYSFEHNTGVPMNTSSFQSGGYTQHRTMYFQGVDFDRHTLKHNILGFCPPTPQQPLNAVKGFGVAAGSPSDWEAMLGDRVWAANAIYDYPGGFPENLPPGGVGVTTYTSMAAAGINADGTLTSTSPLRVGNPGYFGTDGKDIGVDHALLNSVMGNVPTAPIASFALAPIGPNSLTYQFTDTSH